MQEEPPAVDVLLLDGAVTIKMLKPGSAGAFKDYAEQVFLPFIFIRMKCVSRIDIIWDEYNTHSLKQITRSKRGKGVRRRVDPETRLPTNCHEVLHINDNKTELFSYLAEKLATYAEQNTSRL